MKQYQPVQQLNSELEYVLSGNYNQNIEDLKLVEQYDKDDQLRFIDEQNYKDIQQQKYLNDIDKFIYGEQQLYEKAKYQCNKHQELNQKLVENEQNLNEIQFIDKILTKKTQQQQNKTKEINFKIEQLQNLIENCYIDQYSMDILNNFKDNKIDKQFYQSFQAISKLIEIKDFFEEIDKECALAKSIDENIKHIKSIGIKKLYHYMINNIEDDTDKKQRLEILQDNQNLYLQIYQKLILYKKDSLNMKYIRKQDVDSNVFEFLFQTLNKELSEIQLYFQEFSEQNFELIKQICDQFFINFEIIQNHLKQITQIFQVNYQFIEYQDKIDEIFLNDYSSLKNKNEIQQILKKFNNKLNKSIENWIKKQKIELQDNIYKQKFNINEIECYEGIVYYLQNIKVIQNELLTNKIKQEKIGMNFQYSELINPLEQFIRIKLEKNNYTFQSMIFVINIYYFIKQNKIEQITNTYYDQQQEEIIINFKEKMLKHTQNLLKLDHQLVKNQFKNAKKYIQFNKEFKHQQAEKIWEEVYLLVDFEFQQQVLAYLINSLNTQITSLFQDMCNLIGKQSITNNKYYTLEIIKATEANDIIYPNEQIEITQPSQIINKLQQIYLKVQL